MGAGWGAGQAHPEVGAGQGDLSWPCPTQTPLTPSASCLLRSLVGGCFWVLHLRVSGRAENTLVLFCNFWNVPAVSDLQTSPEMKIQNKVGSKWASLAMAQGAVSLGVFMCRGS